MKAKKTFIENENDGMINWSPNSASLIAVVNKDQKNKYGEYPGWRIAPGEFPYMNSEVPRILHSGRLTYFIAASVSYSTVQNSSVVGKALNHASHHLYVTKQKDAEAYATGTWSVLNPDKPSVDFHKYFDGENLVQEDMLVDLFSQYTG